MPRALVRPMNTPPKPPARELSADEIDDIVRAEKRRRNIGRGVTMLILALALLALKWWTGAG